ncbi:MAG: universal stress protein [Inquilinaceae bacterium]
MTDQSISSPSPPPETAPRIFLVVVDNSDEWRAALRFACRRAEHTGGRVALLHVIEPAEFQHWLAVEEIIREETRQEAEQQLQKVARDVKELSGSMPVLYLREGQRSEELLALLDDEPSISILVLGASTSNEGPGPLIQLLTTKRMGHLRIPITIVPGDLTDEQIDSLG